MKFYVCVPVYISKESRIGKPSVLNVDKRYIEVPIRATSEGQALQILAGAIAKVAAK